MSTAVLEPIAVVDDERFERHHDVTGPHPESPERLQAARAGLHAALPAHLRRAVSVRPASSDELTRVHDARYLERLRARLGTGAGNLDADTFFSPGTEQATWLAAGAAAELASGLMRGDVRRGFALLRPPGHHAVPDSAMGFCLLNNVAVAAAAALTAGAARVAIVDWDVHHGNGTEAAFYDDPRVLFVSLHQYPFYPGTGRHSDIGRGAGRGTTANLALPAGEGPETYAHAFRRVVLPLLERFSADLILVSAGFDAHQRDPLAGMMLDDASYGAMASALVAQAERSSHGRVGLLLEGGYDLHALESSVRSATEALAGRRIDLPQSAPSTAGRDAVERTRSALDAIWHFDSAPTA